jgi:hypothetical protein
MNTHRHLSSEEIFELLESREAGRDISGCETCQAEAASWSRFLTSLKAGDAELVVTTEWDDLLLRRRIREALSKEKPHKASIFARFPVLRPAFAAAIVAGLVFAVWSPVARYHGDSGQSVTRGPSAHDRLPAWSPLPDVSEDEGLAVLAEWIPTEDELAIARCRASCLAGLTAHEEESLLNAVAMNAALAPAVGATPL